MGIFDFFKVESKEDNSIKEITFTITNNNYDELSKCSVGSSVRLWTQPDMNSIIIYPPGSINGMAELGIVPDNYYRTVKSHILGKNPIGNSGPNTISYDAKILNINGANYSIGIKLFSLKTQEKFMSDIVTKEKQELRDKLDKPYKVTKPISFNFRIIGLKVINLEDLKLKLENLDNLKLRILEKEYYIEHPDDHKIELRDDTDKLLAVPDRPRNSFLLNVIQAFHSGQNIKISKIKFTGSILNITMMGD